MYKLISQLYNSTTDLPYIKVIKTNIDFNKLSDVERLYQFLSLLTEEELIDNTSLCFSFHPTTYKADDGFRICASDYDTSDNVICYFNDNTTKIVDVSSIKGSWFYTILSQLTEEERSKVIQIDDIIVVA